MFVDVSVRFSQSSSLGSQAGKEQSRGTPLKTWELKAKHLEPDLNHLKGLQEC